MLRLKQHSAAGFTLLEVMLVLVLMGLAINMVVPRMSGGTDGQGLRIASERLQVQAQAAHRTALLEGQTIGLRFFQDEQNQAFHYGFLTYRQDQWMPVKQQRLLREITLPDDLTLQMTPGASFWREALDYESSKDDLLEQMVTEAEIEPDIVFWSSGEISPARIQLCKKKEGIERSQFCQEVVLEETGEVYAPDVLEG